MAFTPTEEAKLRAIIESFDSGKTIPEILAVTSVLTTDQLEIVQAAVSKKATFSQILTLINSELGISTLTSKVGGIESGAQVNIIESVKRNGTVLPITSKAVNITVPTQPSDIGAEPALGFTPEQAGVAEGLITALKNGVATEGDTLKKLYDLIVASFSEVQVTDIAARDAYDITKLPTNVFVLDDGDSKWALYKATTLGVNATYVKLSDPDLLNAVMSASQIKASYESNPDTNAFTDDLESKLNSITAIFTTELKATYDGKISPKPAEVTTPYTIGQAVEGGTVFYILKAGDIGYDPTKIKYLITSEILYQRVWSDSMELIGGTSSAIGTGQANTDIITASVGAGLYAAKVCSDLSLNGFTDWYLPSSDEAFEMYASGVAPNPPGWAWIWTSTETGQYTATLMYSIPEAADRQKNLENPLRAVRTAIQDAGYSIPVDGEILLASGNDGKEVKGAGISLASILDKLDKAYFSEHIITSTDGVVQTTEPYAVIGTNSFILPSDFDFSKQSIFFDGAAMVRPTLSQISNSATFTFVPMAENDIRILYYKKTL